MQPTEMPVFAARNVGSNPAVVKIQYSATGVAINAAKLTRGKSTVFETATRCRLKLSIPCRVRDVTSITVC